MPLSALQTRVLSDIISYARREDLAEGSPLREGFIANVVGTSRFPVQIALTHLEKLGVVRHVKHRGYFLAAPAHSLAHIARKSSSAAEDPLYIRIVELRLSRKLSDRITESDLIRLFRTSRNALRRVLSRIQQEGWIMRRPGHGWTFLPLIDSMEAYEESYVFRLAVEPAGILSTTFKVDTSTLETCRRQQELIAGGGYRTMTATELFETNGRFHEAIAACSGNRFILQGVRHVNQLRRLVEYMQAKERPPRKTQADEHLGILDKILRGDFLDAATAMRAHLEGARKQKVLAPIFYQRPPINVQVSRA
jgi:DNA-binding GntR family transcriptional regulator